ncbi:MAG: phosphatidylinositol mannoside acyltransferase [Acidimicrobiaceae bacterium]|nr:phosphatidylinositol mannoside acyltransferase [Acidimicrobiaceae bacterium]MCY4279412.1 phosphatidylinositol mannoside acyltransferase [Acidimicrobiaceae bacterium]MCY4294106.1 phosphatidylinositol mannoside acyltransferase [Acidimicrobiaceae bacterium]
MPSAKIYRAGEVLARSAPAPLSRAAASAGAAAAAVASPQRRRLVRRNLERALGRPLQRSEAPSRVAACFDWYARYYLESFQLPTMTAAALDAGFGYQGVDPIERAVRSGVGPILVLPHLGSWEWAAWWLARIPEFKVTAVVEPLEPAEVFDWFVSFRQRLGMDIVAVGPDAGSRLMTAIKRGDVVCLLADRDVGGNGVAVDFFGERTRLPAGPAVLALRTGAPLIPAAVYWRDGGRHAVAGTVIDTSRREGLRKDTRRVVQDYATALEGLIRAAPEQWHLMSPNWPSDYRALGLEVPESLRGV